MSRSTYTFDRTEAAIDEALERRAFPQAEPSTDPIPAATRLTWHLQDELARIDAAAAVLARGRVAIAEYPIVAVLRGRTVEQAREETRERYRAAMRLAGEAGRLAA